MAKGSHWLILTIRTVALIPGKSILPGCAIWRSYKPRFAPFQEPVDWSESQHRYGAVVLDVR